MARTFFDNFSALLLLRLSALAFSISLVGCAHLPPTEASIANDADTATDSSEPTAAASAMTPTPIDTIYSLLTAEMAGQRQRYDVALVHYMRQAKQTKNPVIAKRAARIAQFLGQKKYILQTLDLWIAADPDNSHARLAAAQAYMDFGDYEQALEHLQHLQSITGHSQYDFLAANANHLTITDKKILLERLSELREQSPDDASLWLATGIMHQYLGDLPQALDDVNQALVVAPKLPTAQVQKARLLALSGQPLQSIKLLNKLQRAHPEHKGAQVLKARIYLDQKMLPEAKKAFADVHQNFPLDPSVVLSLALISEELEQKDDAQEYFYQLLAVQQFTNEAHFYLARMADNDQLHDYAIEQYSQVESGQEFFPAKLRAAALLNEHYDLATAQQFLQEQMLEFPQHRVSLLRIEAELLVENQHFKEASALLSQALEEKTDNIELLYSRALIAERDGDLGQVEIDLRRILELDPNNINALNALGYTFADHNYNLTEALELVLKARELSPDNPAIADSLGWVYFRLGDFEQAQALLQEAFDKIPDHEIAAHFGELLWMQGDKERAIEVWKAGYQNRDNSPVLEETVKRLNVDPMSWPDISE